MSLNNYIVDAGFHELTLDLSNSTDFKLQSKKNVSADVLVHLIGKGQANLEVTLEKDSKLNLFYLNCTCLVFSCLCFRIEYIVAEPVSVPFAEVE